MIKALSIVFLIYFNLIYYPIATLYNVLIEYISPSQKKLQHVQARQGRSTSYLLLVNT